MLNLAVESDRSAACAAAGERAATRASWIEIDTAAITCSIPHLAAGGTATGVLSLQATAAGLTSFHAEVTGDHVDPDLANDHADLTVNVTATGTSAEQSSTASGGGCGGSVGFLLLLGLAGLHGARRRRSLPL